MATQTVEFRAATGRTLTAKVFLPGSDTVVQTASAVSEATNRLGTYTATFTDLPIAEYEIIGFSSGIPVARWMADVTAASGNFESYEKPAVYWSKTRAGYLDAAITSRLATASYTAPPTAGTIADAVWDEAYSEHTTAGTFGKLMDTLRKSNNIIEGTILASPTPTTTVFRISGADYPTGALEHAVLWMGSGASQEQNSAILTTVNNGDGTLTITLEEALTTAPSAGDTVLIDPTNHVHAIADIQAGLATAANLLIVSDRVSYSLAVLVGACSDAQTAAETYTLSIGGNTFTVDYTGLDSSGNRSTTTLSKT